MASVKQLINLAGKTDLAATEGLRWAGDGLVHLGLEAGRALAGAEDLRAAHALLDGRHPASGLELLRRRTTAHPAGRLPAAPLLAAIDVRAREAHASVEQLLATEWARRRYARARRGLDRQGGGHRIDYREADRLARQASTTLGEIYPEAHLDAVHRRGREQLATVAAAYVFSVSAPPSYTAVYALVAPATAAALERAWTDAASDCLDQCAAWADFDLCRQVRSTSGHGLIGWVGVPANGAVGRAGSPRARLAARITVLAVQRASGGRWSPISAGSDALVRTATLLEAASRARLREISHARLGTCWRLDPYTGFFEIPTIAPPVRRAVTDFPRADRKQPASQPAPADGRRESGAPWPDPETIAAALPALTGVGAAGGSPAADSSLRAIAARAMARLDNERPRRGGLRAASVVAAVLDATPAIRGLAAAREVAREIAPEAFNPGLG